MARIKWTGMGRREWQGHVWEQTGAVIDIESEDEAEALLTRLEGFEEEEAAAISPSPQPSPAGRGSKKRKAIGG